MSARVSIEPRDLTRYPFLRQSQQFLAGRGLQVETLASSALGRKYLDMATDRVICAIDGKDVYPWQPKDPVGEVASYLLARMIVSCTKDRRLMEKLCRMEARRIYANLQEEERDEVKELVSHELGTSFESGFLPVTSYITLAAGIRDDKWRLVNRDVEKGRVPVTADETEILTRERIRIVLADGLPMTIPPKLENSLQPWCEKISAVMQERTLEEFGVIDESAYPPCIQALIASAAAGVNLSHAGRFAMTAFLSNIGMNAGQVAGVFARSPDFNPDMTMYQVDHITSNEYTTPSCATMLTHGVCVNKDSRCRTIAHPLTYYKAKKKELERKQRLKEGNP
jgi:DNA primase large subunit